MSSYVDFKKEHSKSLIEFDEYYRLTQRNKQFYPDYSNKKKDDSMDIDEAAFLGMKIDYNETFPYKVIPYGVRILESFQVGQFIYMRTFTGYFFKKMNDKTIRPIPQSVFDEKKPFKKVFNSFKKSLPQAGLTRGSKWTNLEPQKDKKTRLFEIQSKYLEGVV